MAEEAGSSLKTLGRVGIAIFVVAFAGLATFSVISDTSIHGLTLRFYGNVSRNCNYSGTYPILIFIVHTLTVYSSNSLTTSLSHVTFAMSTDGIQIGTVNGADSRFNAGQSFTYSPIFSNPTIDPHSQPLVSNIMLSINAQVSAGLYSGQAVASDTETVHFSSLPC